MIVTKSMVLAATGVTTGLAVMTGSTLLAEGIVVDTPYALAALAGAGGVIAVLFKLLIASKDREFAAVMAERDRELKDKEHERLEMESMKKTYKEIAAEAVKSAAETTNYYRVKEGKPPVVFVAPVISESHSPSTPKQRETAEIQTLRASMAAIKLSMGQLPRVEPEKSHEKKDEVT